MNMLQTRKIRPGNILSRGVLLCCGIVFVCSLLIPSGDVEGKTPPIPPEPRLKQLVSKTIHDLALAINTKDFANFYRTISKIWQAQTTKEDLYTAFQSFVDENLDLTVLKDLEPIFSKKPYVTKEGTLVIQGYYPIDAPFKYFLLKYVYESPAWKLFSIEIRPAENLLEGGEPQTIPPGEHLTQLIQQTMLDFALAIKARDFTGFHATISEIWQSQITKQELADIFKSFFDQNIDLTGLQELNPILTPDPELNADGILVLQGRYPTQPSTVFFTLKYVYEESAWKLLGINVNVTPAEKTEGLPSDAELKQLVQATMLDFALAVKAKDFTGFYKQIAQLWQSQITKDELANIFQAFMDQNIDLTGLQELDPVFTETPALTADEVLVLQGNYPSKPSGVEFTLKYIFEESQWKLIGININVK
jgi:hypothetical protein